MNGEGEGRIIAHEDMDWSGVIIKERRKGLDQTGIKVIEVVRHRLYIGEKKKGKQETKH